MGGSDAAAGAKKAATAEAGTKETAAKA
jgi:hypothetical protein